MEAVPGVKSVQCHFKDSFHKVLCLLAPCRSALSAVRRGGVVVYSTCTLSSFENWAVVETVLNDFPEAELEDLREEIAVPLSKYFAFSPHPAGGRTHSKPPSLPLNRKQGILVVPQPGRTWGPMFLSRIRRK